jgi:predicted transcriptional regulator
MPEQSSELEIQKQIYSLVVKEPGLTLSKVAETLGISVELARYHLQYLEKNEIVSSTKEEKFRRYFLVNKVGVREKEYFSVFRQEMLLKIVLFILHNPYARHGEIVIYFNIRTRSLLSYYLNKLQKKEIIQIQFEGKERRYVIVNEMEIIQFLMKYEPYSAVDGIQESWTQFTVH